MSIRYPAATLQSGRNVIDNAIAELQHLTKGDSPVAWDMARKYAEEILEAAKTAHIELAHYTQHQASLADLAVLTAEEEEAMDAIEFAHPHTYSPELDLGSVS